MNADARRGLQEACCQANRRLPALGIVDLTFGNVSVCDRALGVFAIKASGVPYDALTPEHMVVLPLDAEEAAAPGHALRPSSDTPTHRRLYQAFEHANCVVHTHARMATAFAQAARPLPCLGTTHADFFAGPVPVTAELSRERVGKDYELQTAEAILECFAEQALDPQRIPAVLVRSHGPFAWGPSWQKALDTAFALEVIAQMALATLTLLPDCPAVSQHLHERHYLRKHGPTATYGQPASR